MEPINLGKRSFNEETAAANGPQEGVKEAFHKEEELLLDVGDLSMPVVEDKPTNFKTCNVCGKQFKNNSLLNKHSKIHSEGEYACEKCGKRFKCSSNRNKHEREVHSTVTYPCYKCGKEFKSEHYLKVHMEKKHGIVAPKVVEKNQKKEEELFRFTSSKKPSENILQYLSSCSESSTDVTIYCSDGTVAAHKLVLASLSKMLFKVFKCQDHEDDTSILLPDFTVAQISSYFKEIFLGADVLQDPQYLNLNTTLALASEITKAPNNIQVKDEVNDSCDNEEIFSCDTKILFKKEDEDHENSEAFAVKLKENECFESYDDNEDMFSSVTTIIFKKEDRDHENSVESTVNLKEKIKSNFDTGNNEEINFLNVLANDRGMYPCDQCDFEATTRRNLRAHKARTDGHREQGIKYCKRISKVWLHFTQDPTDEKRSVCKYCNASFSTNSSENTKHMASHLNSKHDILIEKRKMKMAPKTTNPVWEYLDEDPSDPYKVLCKICGLRLTRFSGPRHVKTKHDMGGTKEKFQCSYCPKTFRDGTHKKIHEIRKHTKNYEHHCEVCGKGFAERNVLEVHLAEEHNNTSEKNTKYVRKPVICPHCGSSFATKGSLQSHIKNIHEGFKFQCPYCDYSNGRKANLDMHIKIKHEGITLPCPHCNYKATRESNLKVHIKTVHEGLRFNCPHCDFQVTRKDYLEKHISSAHAAMISAS